MNWDQLLCSGRIRSSNKAGISSDLRTEFEKDYHRIIGSASFRRLQDKTQVFPLDKSDFVRTRLTHSLEVSSFCKSLGQNISSEILRNIKDPSFRPEYQTAVCDILQCAGLIHDIGNPPFGHFGEDCIRSWFRKHLSEDWGLTEQMKQDFYHFEGNTQALRLVTKLHYLVDEHGMNLTKALLGTIIKYPVSSLDIDKASGDIRTKKMGYFYADKENFEDIQRSLGTEGCRHPLTFVLEAADDIAYKTADIEDAFKKGCITYEQLVRELKAQCPQSRHGDAYTKLVELLEKRHRDACMRGRDKPESFAIQNWIVSLQGKLIACATYGFKQNYSQIMAGVYKKDLFADSYGEHMMDALGDIAYRYAFRSEPIIKLEIAADTIFTFLLDRFVDAAVHWDSQKASPVQEKLMSLVSDNYKSIYRIYAQGKDETERLYLRLLLVTDFICGMTDTYAKDLYQQFNGIQ